MSKTSIWLNLFRGGARKNPALAAIMFLTGILLLSMFLGKPLATLLGDIIIDDAFYYLVPAQNFLQGIGTSFDGLNLTNGYHPLWMLFAIVGSWLAPAALEMYLLPLMSGVFYLLGAAALSLFLFPQRSVFEKAVLFAVFCFNFYIFKIFLSGMENGLNFFILSLMLIFLQNHFAASPSPRKFYILGGMLGLLALSRVDHILFAFFIFGVLFFLYRDNIKALGRNSVAVGIPIAILFGGYLCMNKLVFDASLPVSGLVKNFYEEAWLADGWPHGGFWQNIAYHIKFILGVSLAHNIHVLDSGLLQVFSAGLPGSLGEVGSLNRQSLAAGAQSKTFLILYGILGLVFMIGFLFSFYKVRRKELSVFYPAFAAFALFHFLLYAVRLPHFAIYGTWYFTFEFLIILLSFFFGVEACFRFFAFVAEDGLRVSPKRLYHAFAALFFAATFLLTYIAAASYSSRDERVASFHKAALWINENLPEQATIGAHSAGTLGYFVENRHVVNLDGFINSVEYFQVLKEEKFADYVLRNIHYYADYSSRDLEQEGICWQGCVSPDNLQLLEKWKINETDTYFIFRILP